MISQITEVMQLLKAGVGSACVTSSQSASPKDVADDMAVGEAGDSVEIRCIYDWCKTQYSLDLIDLWEHNKDSIFQSLPSQFRHQELYPIVASILRNSGIPPSDINNLRFGTSDSRNRRGHFIPTAVARLAGYGARSNVGWWSRRAIGDANVYIKADDVNFTGLSILQAVSA
jgi:hypothetical protein